MKLDWKLTVITLVAFIGLNPIFSMIHEGGHAYVCWSNGYNFIINPTITGTYFACDKFVGDNAEALRLTMWMAGGFFASGAAFIVFATTKHILKGRKKGISYALVTIGTMHFVQLILETFAHDFYMEGKFTIPILTFGSLILLLILIKRGSETYQKVVVDPPYKSKPDREIPQSVFKRDIRDILSRKKPKIIAKYYTEDKPRLLQDFEEPLESNKDEIQ